MYNFFGSISANSDKATTLFVSFIVECITFLIYIVQDICKAMKEEPPRFTFDNGCSGIPFVDRKELLQNIIHESTDCIKNNDFYYTKNIRYGEHNGKTAFAKRLCYEFQKLKDRETDAIKTSWPKMAKKLGNIIYINYANFADDFNSRIKTEFTYIKGKKNIIVVDNAYENFCLWTDDLADSDIFFIFLNFNNNSNDALFFADDKIKELLIALQNSPVFSSISVGKTEQEINKIATRLGSISNNNIGTIIDLLLSKDFSILIETDEQFLNFYFAIKHGRYKEAAKLYNSLPTSPTNNKVLNYKTKYEQANLTHFLGNYSNAFDHLDLLLAELINDRFIETTIGNSLYNDIILLQAHVKKHQGRFSEASSILTKIEDGNKTIPWLRAHFSVYILQLNELEQFSHEWNALLEDLLVKMNEFKEKRKIKDSDYYFYEAFYPIACFYQKRFDKNIISRLIKIEDQAIAYYEKEERRYLTNCYFIKAELYRIKGDWKNAEEYYHRCYNIYCNNDDKDILFLVAFSCKCLEYFEKVKLNIPFNWDDAIKKCKMLEDYSFHNRLISQMEIAINNKEFCKNWLQHYRSTINPIP